MEVGLCFPVGEEVVQPPETWLGRVLDVGALACCRGMADLEGSADHHGECAGFPVICITVWGSVSMALLRCRDLLSL